MSQNSAIGAEQDFSKGVFMLAFLMLHKISILEASKTLVMPYKTVFYKARKLRGVTPGG